MKRPHSFRAELVLFGLLASACSVDGKGLGSGDTGGTGAGTDGGVPTASGGRIGSTGSGGAVASSGGSGPGLGTGGVASGGAPGSGGISGDGTGGIIGTGTGGDLGGDAGAGGPTGSGGAEAGTGGAPQPGTGGAGTGGRGTGTGGAGTGGAPMPACNAMNCPNGCCMGAICITNRTDQRCGTMGAACAACGSCFQCSNMGVCTPDNAARWDLVCVSATVTPTRNGLSWDPITPNQPLPDPFCRLTVDGENRGMTDTKMETLMPVWNQSITGGQGGGGTNLTTAVLTAMNPRWSVSVLDSDGAIDDAVCSVSSRLTPADLTAGTVTFANKDSCQSLTLKIACAQN